MLPDKTKSVVCSIIGLALSFWMKHLVIGQLNSRLFIGQHLEVRLSLSAFGNQQGSTFTKTNCNGLIHHIGCLITQSDCNGPILVLVSTDFDNTGCLITYRAATDLLLTLT